MNNIVFLNLLILLGILVSAVLTVYFDDLLSSIIALGVVGAFVTLEFILLHAPDVAIAEAAVGVVLQPVIFIVALKKVKGLKDEKVFNIFFTDNIFNNGMLCCILYVKITANI